MKTLTILTVLLLPAFAHADDPQPSDGSQVQKIGQLPIAQCQRDLTKLHDIYGQMKNMSSDQAKDFLQSIVAYIRSNNLQLPPPPKPCSSVHLALESRCGNVSDAESKCQNASTGSDTDTSQ